MSSAKAALQPLFVNAMLSVMPMLLLVASLAFAAVAILPLPAGYATQSVTVFAGLVLGLLPFLPQHLPLQRFGIANRVTLLRAGLVALIAGLVGRPLTAPALAWCVAVLTVLALILDGVDGWLARRTGMQSPFGARFDMEVDAFFILILAVLVYQSGRVGGWVLWSGAMRYGFVALGYALPWLQRPLPPRKRRQTVCVFQTVALAFCLTPLFDPAGATVLAAAALGTLTLSFVIDVVWLIRYSIHQEETLRS